jgi:hypothetical protein
MYIQENPSIRWDGMLRIRVKWGVPKPPDHPLHLGYHSTPTTTSASLKCCSKTNTLHELDPLLHLDA